MGKELKRLLVPFQGISNLVRSFGFGRLGVAELSRESRSSLFLSHPGATNQHLTELGLWCGS